MENPRRVGAVMAGSGVERRGPPHYPGPQERGQGQHRPRESPWRVTTTLPGLSLPRYAKGGLSRQGPTAMTPEEQARTRIDQQLTQAGWAVQDYRQMDISAGLGVAVREFPLKTGEADYLLYIDCRAAGVVEAKPEGHTLSGVETQ